jgi:heptosyltransferase-3
MQKRTAPSESASSETRSAQRRPGRSSWIEKWLDRYVGTFLVAAVAVLRRKRARPSVIDKIGILQTAAIGDTVLTTALVRALRARYRRANITLFLGPSNAGLAPLIGDVDDVTMLPVKRPIEALRILRRQRADVLVDCGPWPRLNALYTACAGAQYTIGFKSRRQHRHYAYDCVVEHSVAVHEVDNLRRLATALGADDRLAPGLVIPPEVRVKALARPFVIFHPWSGGSRAPVKEWPLDRWVALGVEIAARGYRIAVTGSGVDRSRSTDLVHALEHAGATAQSIAGACTLPELASLLTGAAAVVSVDTGVMHMAAAVGAPVIALHGPTRSRRWGPVGPYIFPVDAPGEGCGYLHFGFEREPRTRDCMRRITIEAVMECVDRALALRTRHATPAAARA